MEEKIIRKYYNEYLSEAFDLDIDEEQNNCYIISDQRMIKYFINPKKKTIDKYFEIGEFYDGYALVKTEKGYNFINEQGELLSQKWFLNATDFHNGYALVGEGNLLNFIDTEGNYIFKEPQIIGSDSKFSSNGVATVYYIGKGTTIINTKGKKIINFSFDSVDPFYGKYAVATLKIPDCAPSGNYAFEREAKYIIDCDGNYVRTNFAYLKQVGDNIFVAGENKNGKKYLINAQGERIGNKKFDQNISGFKEGYMVVENDGLRNIIGKDGEYLYKNWYMDISPLKDGICRIKADFKYQYLNSRGEIATSTECYNFLDLEGNLISPKWFEKVYNFHDGMAVVGNVSDHIYQILYRDGTLSSVTFSDINEAFLYLNEQKVKAQKERAAGQAKKELYRVYGYGHINYEFPDGTLFFNNPPGLVSNMSNDIFVYYYRGELEIYNKYGEKITSLSNVPFLYNTTVINLKTITETPKVKKVSSTKKWFHYSYVVDGKKYLLDYEPVVDYGDIVICEYRNLYYVFEKATLNTTELGEKANISLEANYIRIGDKKYFILGTDFIDITDLPFSKKISKKAGVTKILTFDEFKSKCQTPEYKEKIAEEVEKLKNLIEQAQQERIVEEVKQKREEEKKIIAEKKESLRQSLSSLSEILAECSKYINEIQLLVSSNSYEQVNVPEELLLVSVADHLEINPLFLSPGILKFVDLGAISFKNVKVSGVDLSYTNAKINPQEVYQKDMSDGKYCGLDFNLASFKGVKTFNSDFTDAILDFATDTETLARQK